MPLSPHLKCLSPHVAIGDKVGHRWTKVMTLIDDINRLTTKTNDIYLLIFSETDIEM